ncbi:MAG: bifunctional riboflavin kinase/FAD synthetase [Candidatus Omnitrophota bacterium]|nr:bifunctional riboflavin kinase/FAD synthetase [Candidatus Omnitrophota bacterium]
MKKTLYPTVVTIGIFDGVHKGHQAILKKAVKEAKKSRFKSVVITFNPHPVKVLNPVAKIPLLISLEHRIKLIKGAGIDDCRILKFTKAFSKMTAEEFIKKILIDKLNLKVLVAGENFLFGFKEKGDKGLLKKLSRIYNFKFYSIPPLKIDGDFVSSTRIRKAIERGDLRLASKLLGRPVTILGAVVKGKRIGRIIGFPTANIDPHHESIPPSGVYSVDIVLGEKLYRGILNISARNIVEAHIFNFNKNIYGKDIKVIFKQKIREEKKFNSLEALQRQIHLDIQKAA